MLTEPVSEIAPGPQMIRWSDQVAALAIIELGKDGTVRTWNAGAERIKRYSRDEIVGEHFSRFYRPEDRRRGVPDALLASALVNGYVEDTGWRVRADGELFWAHVTITSIRNAHGQPTGFVKIVRDLTASKRADDERNAFLRALAHDFLSPITAVRGYVDLLEEGESDPATILPRLSDASDHLLAMSKTLGALLRERPEPRRSELTPVGAAIREAASLVLPGDLYGRLSIAVPEDAFVRADRTELRRAVQNVLENAAKYSEGVIDVRVEADEHTVEIVVRDRGRGIHPDDLSAVLQEGVRGRLARGDDGGSGIGLASAARAIESDGGTIVLDGTPDRGTTVRISLPRAQVSAAA